jgi:hypothetical protein
MHLLQYVIRHDEHSDVDYLLRTAKENQGLDRDNHITSITIRVYSKQHWFSMQLYSCDLMSVMTNGSIGSITGLGDVGIAISNSSTMTDQVTINF